ncbi:right-handed parallel beta-helix repeat-containing protein [Nostoc spongiaeforme FACHB-130]|uniref:Right-handed parallel beta-helix repeat-containing protein n=1 Tax=Nostoc spongiaeforme FACHB-130 TaxID=1357510 RepID=A0ABR8FTR8_9NOSO|nr:right-handed parallel beta-helix repeat-containing protein [Nostoc spongiaeforme]MBD2594438.1 right-handed parallel beta-helix repeat-containing protein [Nostoc spongiaeforme FACHB-130]
MKLITLLGYGILLGAIAISSTAIAQTPEPPPIFQPRFGVRYTTEGAGFDAFSSLEGFLPIFQSHGNSLTFLEGKVLLDNNSTVASNILFGHRFYSGKDNRVIGGYISYSTRDTGNSNFDQLGLGFESLGNWDFRFNAYLPLNTSEALLSQSVVDSNSRFLGNSLLVGRQRLFEVALSGIDAEVGTSITKLGAGELRGYAGVYYYSGGDSKEAFGWKTRLAANPTDFLNLGLSLQQDNLFDTRLVFTIGANFPSGSRKSKPKKNNALFRIAESVERQATILATHETRNDTVIATGSDGQPLTFFHVINGGNGNGTFESPFGAIASAVGVAQANNIVYVRSNSTATFAGFTIPNGVQVLSSAPIQRVNTQEFGLLTLPFSGSGIHPIITGSVTEGNGLVTLGSNTVLSGFNIQVSGEENAIGVYGANINNTSIRDNIITNPFGRGIRLEFTTGNLEILTNTIANSGNDAIYLVDVGGTIIINSNNITNAGDDGISLDFVEGNTTISNNTINNTGNEGIDLEYVNGAIAIINNTVSDTEDQGIDLTDINATMTISNNIISNSGDEGIYLEYVHGNTTISNNIINNSGYEGIDLEYVNGAIAIINNTVNNSISQGIELQNIEASTTISNNIISNSGDDGIFLELINGTTKISSNTITNSGSSGIYLGGIIGMNEINSNTITNSRNGLYLNQVTGTVTIHQNTVTDSYHYYGIVADNSTGAVNLSITNNNLSQNFNDVRVNLSGTATGTLQIIGNNINSTGAAVDVQLGSDANLSSITINNNQIQGVNANVTSNGINLQTFDNVVAHNVMIVNNAINIITNGDGINAQVNGNSQTTFTISANVISNVRDFDTTDFNFTDGINIEAFDNANSTFTITNNVINQIDGLGISVNNFSSGNVNFTNMNNQITNTQ